jgi:histidinol-phosphate aminotransferase
MKLPDNIRDLPPYSPIEPFDVLSARYGRLPSQIVKLDANENPYGISPLARQALSTLQFPNIYPDPESRRLRAALSNFTGVPVDNLMAGSGADELIDLIARLVLESGDAVINCPPTFGMYPFDTQLNAGRLVEVPRHSDFSLDMQGIWKAVEQFHPKILYLASPNNPDGGLLSSTHLSQLLSLPLLVVLDEAYIEFADEQNDLGRRLSNITQVPTNQNLIVLRTFSKWAGLAGLRIGYGSFPTWLMPILWKAKQPYNVNVAASEAAVASLDDLRYLGRNVALIRKERKRLIGLLQAVPYLEPISSYGNFVLCQVVDRSAFHLKTDLAEKYGVLVRYFDKPGLRNYLRISVGKPAQTDSLLEALKCLE